MAALVKLRELKTAEVLESLEAGALDQAPNASSTLKISEDRLRSQQRDVISQLLFNGGLDFVKREDKESLKPVSPPALTGRGWTVLLAKCVPLSIKKKMSPLGRRPIRWTAFANNLLHVLEMMERKDKDKSSKSKKSGGTQKSVGSYSSSGSSSSEGRRDTRIGGIRHNLEPEDLRAYARVGANTTDEVRLKLVYLRDSAKKAGLKEWESRYQARLHGMSKTAAAAGAPTSSQPHRGGQGAQTQRQQWGGGKGSRGGRGGKGGGGGKGRGGGHMGQGRSLRPGSRTNPGHFSGMQALSTPPPFPPSQNTQPPPHAYAYNPHYAYMYPPQYYQPQQYIPHANDTPNEKQEEDEGDGQTKVEEVVGWEGAQVGTDVEEDIGGTCADSPDAVAQYYDTANDGEYTQE